MFRVKKGRLDLKIITFNFDYEEDKYFIVKLVTKVKEIKQSK